MKFGLVFPLLAFAGLHSSRFRDYSKHDYSHCDVEYESCLGFDVPDNECWLIEWGPGHEKACEEYRIYCQRYVSLRYYVTCRYWPLRRLPNRKLDRHHNRHSLH